MVTYRLATEADYVAINTFYNRIYQSHRTMEQFYWEFHNGSCGPSVYVIALDGDRIVGTNCVIPIDLILADKTILRTGKSEDTLVDPEYRGRKIFNHIYDFLFERCKEQGIKVIWGFTSAKKPFENVGFSVPYEHQQSLMVNNVGKSYRYISSLNPKNTWKEKMKILALCYASKLKTVGLSGSAPAGYEMVEDQKIVNGVDELIQTNLSATPQSFAIHQNPAFQQWRVYANPHYVKVHTFGFYDSNKTLKGLLVLNSHTNGVAYVVQASFHALVPAADRIKMVKCVSKKLFMSGICLLRSWHFNTNALNTAEIKTFVDAKYFFLKRGIGFVWIELDKANVRAEDFYLSRISTQGVI